MDLVNILRGIFNPQKQSTISSKDLPNVATSPKEQETLRRIGVTTTDLNKAVQQMLYVGQDRRSVYTAAENSLEEPIMSGSVSLYADTSAGKSNSNNKSIWAESKSKEYKYQIDKLFDIINIEEILYDITWSTCLYGDHFIRVNGQPGVGVTSIEDDDHPLNFNRVDVNGRLVGFFETQMGMSPASTTELLPPWSVVHFRLLGAKRKRPLYSTGLDYTSSSEYRAINLVTPGERRISSKYGVSVLNDALIAYKRYKMCKDSLMLTRLSKGQLRYIYSIGVGNNASAEAVASILDEMGEVLKKARCLSGETEISLLDSTTPTIKEMAEQSEKYIGKYIFSINPITKAIEPDKIVDVRKTLINTEVIRVHLDNKQYIDCTPDHRFMLRDGTYKEAQHLKSGESLMPLYTKNILGRRLVFNPSISKYEYIYQNAAKFILGKTPKNYIIHHTLEVVNHKVVRIEYLPYTQDTYDITTERNHNFALTNGVFVHNSIDISAANPNAFKDRMNYLSNVEDIIIPVWGDVNQFKVDKIGENPDVKWIRDIDELRQDLFASLRVAPQLLGAYMAEMPSGMGDNTLERLDIRFARQCKRIQKTLLSGIERLIQIHLAYQGLDPDLNQFEVKIAEISSAEEEELKNGLKTGTESVSTFVETLENMFGEKLDRVKLMKYINEKFLKLNDFNIEDMLLDLKQVGPLMATGPTPETEEGANQPAATTETPRAVSEPPVTGGNPFRSALNARVDNSDLKSMLPIHEARWKELYGETKIKITEG